MTIPMVDLNIQYESIKEEIDSAVLSVIRSASFILGPQGKALEQDIAAYHGVKHAVGVASGTDALHLALRAAGVSRETRSLPRRSRSLPRPRRYPISALYPSSSMYGRTP